MNQSSKEQSLKKVLLLCGGRSGEHDVSLASARSVVSAAEASGTFQVQAIVISKEGKLLSLDASKHVLTEATAIPDSSELEHLSSLANYDFDIIFPLLHGPYGEDGTIQGLLELLDIPYVGSGVLGSAVGMDKIMMKAVYAAYGLPQVDYKAVLRSDWQAAPEAVLNDLETILFPLFVKPANLGSSVGIGKARTRDELHVALDEAAKFDRRIIVEAGIRARELEVAVLGNDNPQASVVGEIAFESDFYDYETKYTDGKADLFIPAHISDDITQQCRNLAIEAFKAVDAAGIARVDFFLEEETNKLYLNEINTMPGFTATSMYPKLWEASGIPYPELIQRLINLGLDKA